MSAIRKVTIATAVSAVLLGSVAAMAAMAAGPAAAAGPARAKAACSPWNGVQPPDRNLAALAAVTVLPTCQAWAVGATRNPSQLLIEEVSGSTWNKQAIPLLTVGAELAGVTATAADNAWAVGSEHPAAAGKKVQPLI